MKAAVIEMYRVVIIDDEPIIVEGICRIVPWQELSCEVVGTAGDGIAGSEIIRRKRPHIVITDIAMPEMDGLTMIAGLKSEFPDMQVIILTGYRDFDYAKEALELGVNRFLLKPSNLEEIREAIQVSSRKVGRLYEEDEKKDQNASCFIVEKALEYIGTHYQDKLTLSDVAEKTFVSQWHLSKLLNKQLGQNFSAILNGRRIEKAKELLENPAYRIGEISEKVGFVDLAHFSRVFKKMEGISANEYRNTKVLK